MHQVVALRAVREQRLVVAVVVVAVVLDGEAGALAVQAPEVVDRAAGTPLARLQQLVSDAESALDLVEAVVPQLLQRRRVRG